MGECSEPTLVRSFSRIFAIFIYIKNEKSFQQNEKRSRDAAAKKSRYKCSIVHPGINFQMIVSL